MCNCCNMLCVSLILAIPLQLLLCPFSFTVQLKVMVNIRIRGLLRVNIRIRGLTLGLEG